ncbi:MMPL family transporter [Nocardia sp. NPDC050712]|uniref:MMPL family transporter n=1 Tax=Nocardia sp. NPDC050712 TaxID=3155518 RepID=UPI00340EA724
MAAKAFDLEMDTSVNSILLVVLFGVGTDYILFLMFRYRERLRAGEDPKTAMVSAISVGIAIAAFVMAMFFTPAVTALLGRAAWWPGHGDRTKVVSGQQPDGGCFRVDSHDGFAMDAGQFVRAVQIRL